MRMFLSDHLFIHVDDGAVGVIQFFQAAVDQFAESRVAVVEVIGSYHVKDQVGVGGACHNAEIVDGQAFVYSGYDLQNLFFQAAGLFVVDADGCLLYTSDAADER